MGFYEAEQKLIKAAIESEDIRAKSTLYDIRYFLCRALSRDSKRWEGKIDDVISYVLRGNYAMCDDAIRKMLNKRDYSK